MNRIVYYKKRILLMLLFLAVILIYIYIRIENTHYVKGLVGKDTIDIYSNGLFSLVKIADDICLECNTEDNPFTVILSKVKKTKRTIGKVYFYSYDGYAIINNKDNKCYICYVNKISKSYNYKYFDYVKDVKQYVVIYNDINDFSQSDIKIFDKMKE